MMEKSTVIDFDISKEFEADFGIELDSDKIEEEKENKRKIKNTSELRKQLITIDGNIVEG